MSNNADTAVKPKADVQKAAKLTFKDLKKRVSIDLKVQQQTRLFDRLDNMPYWVWNAEDIRTNGDCCFNHIIGLPKKNDIERPACK